MKTALRIPLLQGQPAPVARFRVIDGRKKQPRYSLEVLDLAESFAELERLKPKWMTYMRRELVNMLRDARRMDQQDAAR